MNTQTKSPVLNPMARQNVYISPRLNPINQKFYLEPLSLSSDDSTISSDTNSDTSSDTSSRPFFSSNDSLMSLEDYRINIGEEKKQDDYIRLSSHGHGRGIISSICCSWCSRN
jgi:hypothetical protein